MKFLTAMFFGLIANFFASEHTLLQQIQARGELRVVTRHSPTTYYENAKGEGVGLEYDLVRAFAEELGVTPKFIIANSTDEMLRMVAHHEVDFAAAGLTIHSDYSAPVRFSTSYQSINQHVVYREGNPPPSELTTLNEKFIINVASDSSQLMQLKRLKKQYPQLTWQETSDTDSSELLERVWDQEINYTIGQSHEVARLQHFYPELQIGLKLPEAQHLGWAFPRFSQDDSLYLVANQFLERLRRTGVLEQIMDRYYGHVTEDGFDYVNMRTYYRHIRERLPLYRNFFEQIAARHGMDWRLLAAIGYEESQWNPNAESATGVRGLMMLTQSTARELGVKNRDDPAESIEGGARYFASLQGRMEEKIREPDRTWLALASYNVGLGHIIDARTLTAQRGANPNRWIDVRKTLPLLSNPYWYEQTRHGQARGYEPVKFVQNIRRFYEVLTRFENKPLLSAAVSNQRPSKGFILARQTPIL
ncbi:MAG: membrane-bound lytic murein transglycosylase MltF [Thiotrichaceae bacterium]|nr:membrane-bound lytic murein transglycosylase MltF [Thiotrichaceae bacterium]